eukprot:COSAG05_NODE_610_length_8361_cov_211.582789_4_plen_349_part_00
MTEGDMMIESTFNDMAAAQRQIEVDAAPSSRPTSGQVMQNSLHMGEFSAAFEGGVAAFGQDSAASLDPGVGLGQPPGVTDRLARAAQAQAEGRPRSPFKGKLRQHAGTQTLEEEVGDLKQLRRTVAATSQSLEGLGEQIATAASSASRDYALKVEEKVKQVQDAANTRLSFVEKKYEKALLLARQAAGAERAHDLERTMAAQAEEIKTLRKEYEARHVAEIAHTIEERDTFRHKYEEQKEGLQRLNKEHKELLEENAKKIVSKEQYPPLPTTTHLLRLTTTLVFVHPTHTHTHTHTRSHTQSLFLFTFPPPLFPLPSVSSSLIEVGNSPLPVCRYPVHIQFASCLISF